MEYNIDQGWATPVLEVHCPAELDIHAVYSVYAFMSVSGVFLCVFDRKRTGPCTSWSVMPCVCLERTGAPRRRCDWWPESSPGWSETSTILLLSL